MITFQLPRWPHHRQTQTHTAQLFIFSSVPRFGTECHGLRASLKFPLICSSKCGVCRCHLTHLEGRQHRQNKKERSERGREKGKGIPWVVFLYCYSDVNDLTQLGERGARPIQAAATCKGPVKICQRKILTRQVWVEPGQAESGSCRQEDGIADKRTERGKQAAAVHGVRRIQ